MKDILKSQLIGKHLRLPGDVLSPKIQDVRMVRFKEPDTPMNDFWGNEWEELCVVFVDNLEQPIPVKDCLNMDIV